VWRWPQVCLRGLGGIFTRRRAPNAIDSHQGRAGEAAGQWQLIGWLLTTLCLRFGAIGKGNTSFRALSAFRTTPQTARSRQSNNEALPVTFPWYSKLRDSIGVSDPLWAVGNASLVPGEVPSRRSTVVIMT